MRDDGPDFETNVPISTVSGPVGEAVRAPPLQAAQTARLTATKRRDARTRVANICRWPATPVEWRGRRCQCSSGRRYFFVASGGISTRNGHGSETRTLPLAFLSTWI